MKLISQCAEAKIYKEGDFVLKIRTPKSYRLPELDKKIIIQRTRSEAKALEKSKDIILVPKIVSVTKDTIKMSFIEGKKVAEILDKLKPNERKKVCREIGKTIAILHNHDIIHGDLTTSNMILNKKGLYLIDFGLSYIDSKSEHKAVDLHLLKQAFESKHYLHFEESFKEIVASYRDNSNNEKEIMERFKKVEQRGRYKHK